MKARLTIFLLILFTNSFGQNIVSGKISDPKGKPVSGANIFLEGTYDGDSSDENGNFSFETSSTGNQILVVNMLTYDSFQQEISVENFKNQTIKLSESVNTLDAVVITAGTMESGGKSTVSVLKPLDIVTTAGAAGNIVAAFQTLPGTQIVGEDGRLFVRGGEANETQTFVDGIRVPQPYGPAANNVPTRGRFSPFLFKGIAFSTGGYSAEFGEALSGVLLMNTFEEPDENKTDISLMTVGLGIANTQKWEKSSFSVNLAYMNLAPYQAIVPQAIDWNKPYETLGGEMVFRQKFNSGLLKTYVAFDATNFDINQNDINLGRTRVDAKNNNMYVNSSYKGFFGSNYQLQTGFSYGFSENKFKLNEDSAKNQENALHLKAKISKKFGNNVNFSAGLDFFATDFEENFRGSETEQFQSGYRNSIAAIYSEGEIFLSKNFALKPGIRFSYNEVTSEKIVSPRFSAGYKFSETSQISFAFGDFTQTPSQDYLKYAREIQSEKATHYVFNYSFYKEGKTFRAEAYYKNYRDLVRFDTNSIQYNSIFSNEGEGFAKGVEFFWRDNSTVKNLEYYVSYSFIDTERNYRNFPEKATPSFVADHSLSVVTKYWIQDLRSQVGFTNSFNSGRPYNNPNQENFMGGKTKSYNNLSFNWAYLLSQQKILYFSVSNILGTDNIFGYQYANSADATGQFQRQAVRQPADRFFFVGFFWTISNNKTDNQLNNL